MLYASTLPFLKRGVILCRSVVPLTFPTPLLGTSNVNEYKCLLVTLGIPPLTRSKTPSRGGTRTIATLMQPRNSIVEWCSTTRPCTIPPVVSSFIQLVPSLVGDWDLLQYSPILNGKRWNNINVLVDQGSKNGHDGLQLGP
jgi:hypothetical protein